MEPHLNGILVFGPNPELLRVVDKQAQGLVGGTRKLVAKMAKGAKEGAEPAQAVRPARQAASTRRE